MPDLNYLVSTLPAYTEQNREVLVREVVFGTPTVSRITPQTGIKTKAAINYLNANPVLQDGKGCQFTPQNTAVLTQREIATALIKVNESFCPDTLLGKWPEYLVRIPETQRESLPFEQYILRIFRDAIKEKIETLIWQGDKSSNDTDLKWIDGFLVLALDAEGVVKVDCTSALTRWAALKAVISAIPAKVIKKGGINIFVSPEFYLDFVLELVEKNFYHYSGPQDAYPEEIVFPGTNIRVVNTIGLAETDYVVASRPDNMYYGTDVEGSEEYFKVVYDEKNDSFDVKVRWNSGVQFAFPDEVVLGYLAPIGSGSGSASAASEAAPSDGQE